MKREPRLQFPDADLAEPKLEKPIKRVKKAEAKADKAQAKIPKKTVVKKERSFDPATGKVKTQLRFEEVDKKKPPSKLTHAVQDAPANFVLSQVHREVAQSEDDNVGVEAAHKVEQTVESGGRLVQSAHRAHQLKPYRAAIRAEKKLERANIDALQKKAEIDRPTSNPVSKWQQKQAIKKQYAAAKHNQAAQTTAKAAENTAKAAKKAAEKAEKAGKYVWEHRRGFAIAAAILLMLAFLLNGLSSCSVIMDGVGSGIAASTYPSQDADMLGAEAQYCAMEAELQRYLDTYESTHDYDEYHFDLDTIEHDPYVLISMITALHQGEWTLDEVQGTLQMLFDRQYILTEDVVVETRYRTETDTWTDADGNTHTDTYQVPYDYYICTVTLENFNLSHVPVYIMSEEQFGMYATYMATLGNRPTCFPVQATSASMWRAAIPTTTFPRRRWTMRYSPPSSRKRKNISATPTFGAAAVPLPHLTVRASSVGSSIIPVGMWAGWERRGFAISARLYPLPTSNRAIWCFSPERMIPPVSAMWVSTSATI